MPLLKLSLLVCVAKNGKAHWYADIASISQLNRCGEYFILIGDKSYWGKGIGMEVTRLIPDYGFTTLGLHRIELTAYVTNPAAIKAYEKAGYHMKVLRGSLVFVMVNSLIKFKCRYYHMSG